MKPTTRLMVETMTNHDVVYGTGNLTNVRCAELMFELQRLLGPDEHGKPLQLGMHWYGWTVRKQCLTLSFKFLYERSFGVCLSRWSSLIPNIRNTLHGRASATT